MDPKLKKWVGFNFDLNKTFEKPPREGTDESDEMKQFFKDLKSDIKKALGSKGIKIIRMKPNYYSTTIVVGDGKEKYAYISFGDMRWNGLWNSQILVRTMKHDKDWSGGHNNFVNYDGIPDKILELWERSASEKR
ncbi:MAG: hypothetical protein K0R00_70 [Herbinix sp.]|jgi:hypothetical protein|nr:hypothetical protein [Herbinix sp.]